MRYLLFIVLISGLFTPPLAGQDLQVVDVGLETEPREYSGPCPVSIPFKGWITTSGYGAVSYQYERSDSFLSPVMTEQVLEKNLRHEIWTEWLIEPVANVFEGWIVVHVLKPDDVMSAKVQLRIRCTNGSEESAEEAKRKATEEKWEEAGSGENKSAEEEKQKAWDEKQKAIEETQSAEQFFPCPLDTARTDVVTNLPQPWFTTPQIGKLLKTQIDMVGGKQTLICNYWAYSRSVAVMRELPAGFECRAGDGGFYCRPNR